MSYMFTWWSEHYLNRKGYGSQYGWKSETHFKWPKSENDWTAGYACDEIDQAVPDAKDETARV